MQNNLVPSETTNPIQVHSIGTVEEDLTLKTIPNYTVQHKGSHKEILDTTDVYDKNEM